MKQTKSRALYNYGSALESLWQRVELIGFSHSKQINCTPSQKEAHDNYAPVGQ